MKKFLYPLLLLIFAACSQPNKLTTVGPLTLPAFPQAGNEIAIQYKVDSSSSSPEKVNKLTLYYTVDSKIYAREVSFPDSGKILTASFVLPDSAQAFALKFTGDMDQSKGYIFPVYNDAGEPVAGAYAGTGRFYNGQGSFLLGLQANPDTALTLIKKGIAAHPSIKQHWLDLYLNTLVAVKKDSAYPEVQNELQEMLSGDSIQKGAYQTAFTLYSKMNMKSKADSIKAVGIRKYPKGPLALINAVQNFNKQKGLDSMVMVYNEAKEQFTSSGVQGLSSRILSFMASRIARLYYSLDKEDQFIKYAAEIDNPVQQAGLYNTIAWPLAESGTKLEFADRISKKSLELIEEAMNNPGDKKPDYLTEADWKERMKQSYAMFADTYALILNKEGQTRDALAYQKKAIDYSEGKNTDMNERYVKYLVETEDYATAQEQLEKFYAEGHVSEKMKDYLKEVYVKVNQSEEGYESYLSRLEEEAEAKMKAALATKMINKPADDFTLPDLKGNEVSLNALNGKVVIVDFWATWCGPCKASFPGMQKAVNKYKNDSNVVFLFINTWERTKPEVREKQVRDFIASHNYTFHVLMDQPEANDSTEFRVIGNYGVKGIPTKFVIGPKGNIKFKKVGFSGNTEAEVKEIALMIEMAGA